jgi:RHH-type proline utilization regulon transcriptional repressor/proline dehydrogenase/delta 1-pyrroline-5-carboxylate dehydrogenase
MLVDTLPPTVREQLRIEPDWRRAAAAVLYAGPAEDACQLRCELAVREGPLVPLIATDDGTFSCTG